MSVERWPTAEEDPDLRAFGPGLMHVQRIDASIKVNLGTGGVPCPVCAKPIREFCFGGPIPPLPGAPMTTPDTSPRSERIPTDVLVERARATARDVAAYLYPGSIQAAAAITALADRLAELEKRLRRMDNAIDPRCNCPDCMGGEG